MLGVLQARNSVVSNPATPALNFFPSGMSLLIAASLAQRSQVAAHWHALQSDFAGLATKLRTDLLWFAQCGEKCLGRSCRYFLPGNQSKVRNIQAYASSMVDSRHP